MDSPIDINISNIITATRATMQPTIKGLLNPKILVLVIWVVISLIWFLYAIIDFLYRLRLFLVRRQFTLDWFKYIEYWMLIMCITC